MSFDGADAALAVLQSQDFIASSPNSFEAGQAGPLLDAAMLAEATAAAQGVTADWTIMAALEEEFPADREDFAGLDALIARAEAGEDASPEDYQIEPAADLDLIDAVQHSGPIVVTGTRTRYIEIVTDPSPTGATVLPTSHEEIHADAVAEPLIIGLEGDNCPVANTAAKDSLQSLYDNSPTARALIEAAAANGVTINLFTAHTSGYSAQPRFESGVIHWDPFFVIKGTNTNGTEYILAPIMILAHELVHAGHGGESAYQGPSSEPLVMALANQIASEMNAATGTSYDTTRNSHVPTQRFYTQSSTSTTYSIARPGCS